jgi:hypothetical protein
MIKLMYSVFYPIKLSPYTVRDETPPMRQIIFSWIVLK